MATLNIPIPKAGGFFPVDSDTFIDDKFPLHVYLEIMMQGCKTLLNRGQSKLKSTKGLEGKAKEDAVKAIMAAVQEQYNDMLEGKTRITGGKSKLKGIEREVKTEAMRLAKLAVRDAIKASGGKISHYKAKAITEAAEEVLGDEERGPQFMEIAKANVAKRHEADAPAANDEEKKTKAASLVKALGLEADPELVAKTEKANAKKKKAKDEAKPLSEVVAKAKPGHTAHAS